MAVDLVSCDPLSPGYLSWSCDEWGVAFSLCWLEAVLTDTGRDTPTAVDATTDFLVMHRVISHTNKHSIHNLSSLLQIKVSQVKTS